MKLVRYNEFDSDFIDCVIKRVSLGFAFCNPEDEFNEELGKTIAIGRAKKSRGTSIYTIKLGYINTKLVKAFIEQEVSYLKDNPEHYIEDYIRRK